MSKPTRNGTITVEPTENGRATIAFERRLPYPPETVWAAITQPEHRAFWYGVTKIDPRVGGTIEMTAEGPPAPEEMRRMSGRIVVWDPPRVFAHEWRQKIVGDTVVRYELVPDGDGTILRYTHAGMRAPEAKGFIPGEHAYLDRLEAHLANADLPSWQARYAEVAPSYGAPWSGSR